MYNLTVEEARKNHDGFVVELHMRVGEALVEQPNGFEFHCSGDCAFPREAFEDVKARRCHAHARKEDVTVLDGSDAVDSSGEILDTCAASS